MHRKPTAKQTDPIGLSKLFEFLPKLLTYRRQCSFFLKRHLFPLLTTAVYNFKHYIPSITPSRCYHATPGATNPLPLIPHKSYGPRINSLNYFQDTYINQVNHNKASGRHLVELLIIRRYSNKVIQRKPYINQLLIRNRPYIQQTNLPPVFTS